ncbi:hypothetical protein [Nonomuraea maheshkhaliensis]|uniref:hypothetical protein n=1 Tax=Nonomuraea maheshkhaliensis TaxID=419590 RepID=UPI0031F8A8F1
MSATAEIALVPRHPQTGEVWPGGGAGAVVPLAADVWTSGRGQTAQVCGSPGHRLFSPWTR